MCPLSMILRDDVSLGTIEEAPDTEGVEGFVERACHRFLVSQQECVVLPTRREP